MDGGLREPAGPRCPLPVVCSSYRPAEITIAERVTLTTPFVAIVARCGGRTGRRERLFEKWTGCSLRTTEQRIARSVSGALEVRCFRQAVGRYDISQGLALWDMVKASRHKRARPISRE